MYVSLRALLGGVVMLAIASSAQAQTIAASRVFLSLNDVGQLGAPTVRTSFSFTLYEETATIEAIRPITGGRILDITGGVRLGDHWGIAVNGSTRTTKAHGSFTASIPDPTYFNQPRLVSGTIGSMGHGETWAAVLFAYEVRLGDRLGLMLTAGPAAVQVKHDVAASASVIEDAGGPQVSIDLKRISHIFWAYQAGGDLTCLLTKHLGVGGFVRFQHARANLTGTAKLTVGGSQFGGGLRLRF
jgi:hypothetical protein